MIFAIKKTKFLSSKLIIQSQRAKIEVQKDIPKKRSERNVSNIPKTKKKVKLPYSQHTFHNPS